MPIRGVLFDVDDTLSDFSTSEEVGLLTYLRTEGLLDRFPVPSAAVSLWRDIMEAEFGRFLAGELTFIEQQRTRTRRFLSHTGLVAAALSDEYATAWFAGYAAHRQAAWTAFPDAAPVLAALAPNYRLGIVSNSSTDHQRRKLATIGLLPYFGDALTCSAEHGEPKPAPSIFHAGCTSLDLPPHEVAYVGDNYALDAVGARNAGLHSHWLDRTDTDPGTEIGNGIRVIHTLDELPAALSD